MTKQKPLSEMRDKDPITLFKSWLKEAQDHPEVLEAEAMVLSTFSFIGAYADFASSRVVLLKEVQSESFIFYTNYQSMKARYLKYQPVACLNFYWPVLKKQIRLRGKVKKISHEESVEYWKTRSFESQLSQFVSQQSRPLESRELLEQKWQEAKKKFYGKEVPCPKHWGGFAFKPLAVEFWQERPHRLHDRLLFLKKRASFFTFKSEWKSRLLYP